jgi:nucleoside-diphosphate-sugar epimerase
VKTVLLTGAAGFIGFKTAEKLLDRGYRVVGVDNFNDYYDVRLKEYRANLLKERENFKLYKVDIENIDALRVLFEEYRFDGVINLAARAGVRYSLVNPFVYMTTNALGTLNLLELMKDYGVGKFVLASTSSLYAGQPMPFKETLPVNTPISPYAASKKAAEVTSYTYHYLYGIDVTIVRYFTVYGPAGRPDMCIFRFIKWIDEGTPITVYGDGTQSRDFTFVDDIAEGTVLPGVFHIPKRIFMWTLIHLFRRQTINGYSFGKGAETQKGKDQRVLLDILFKNGRPDKPG